MIHDTSVTSRECLCIPRVLAVAFLTAVAALLAGCPGSPDSSEETTAKPPGTVDAPSIIVYMTDFRDHGEVVGITAASDEFIDLTVRLEGAEGDALADAELKVSSLAGNDLSHTATTADAAGEVALRVRPRRAGEDVLTFTGAGISKQVSLYITDEAYGHPMEHLSERATELPDVEGAVPWRVLTDIELREDNLGLPLPVFTPEVRALDGKDVRVQGFMLPLDNNDRQSHFLLVRTPPSCFYCLPGGPENVVEVRTSKPVPFGFDPIVIAGRMELLEDSDLGLFYRMDGGRLER